MSEKSVLTKAEQDFLDWMLRDQKRKVGNFKELNKIAVNGQTAFVGDSIIEGFPIRDIISDKGIIYNRGISGYKAYQLENNMNDIVLDIEPSKIFLLIGTNDVADDRSSDEIVKSIQHIANQCEQHLPESKFFILSILPVHEQEKYKEGIYIRTNKFIQEVNRKIRELVDNSKYLHYIDAYTWMLEGYQLREEYTYDGIHLSILGYVQLSKLLRNYL